MLCFENASRYVLNDVTIHIPRGEMVGLIGASGAGKTTFIKLACGLLAPRTGKVRALGKDPAAFRGKYGADFSAFIVGIPLLDRLDSVKTGFEILREIYDIPEDIFRRDYSELAEGLGFGRYENERIMGLSLGQKMRAELGAALIYRPKLLLLDEPNVGLDENGKAALRELLTERKKNGMTALISSHDMSSVSAVCGRIALLNNGGLAYYGSEENLRKKYAPIDVMTLRFNGKIPNPDDLPLVRYSIEGNVLTLAYNANHITAAEILRLIITQTGVSEISVRKSDLESIIAQINEGI